MRYQAASLAWQFQPLGEKNAVGDAAAQIVEAL